MKTGERIRDYVLERRIGAGGVGEVWRARHERLNKPVAIKLILPHLYQDENIYNRFVQEAIATANLEHPHIISVHDFFSVNEDAFLVMSYVEGGSLQDRIKKRGRLSLSETLYVARGILDALDFAHQKGIVHRDVKPSNILLSPDLHGYLVDFGIALVLGKTRITRFGANVGTPDYMSPEQIRGEQLDHRTDVYSFGCVLYEMLAGRSPFRRSEDDTEFTLMERHMSEEPASLRKLNPEVNEETEAAVMRSLAKDREKRFAGCADMAKALVVSESASVVGTAKSPYQTSTASKFAIAVLALAAMVSAGGWIAAYSEKEPLTSAAATINRDAGALPNDARNSEEGLSVAKKIAELEAANETLRKEIRAANFADERAEKEVQAVRERLAAAGQTAKTTTGKLENELQAANAAKAKALKEASYWKDQLAAIERAGSDQSANTIDKLQKQLQAASAAREKALKEARDLKQQLATKDRDPPDANRPVYTPTKTTREITRRLTLAREYRERGAYEDALSELTALQKLDPSNATVVAEMATTRRAC
ncbi:MAG: protein kinase domain-containing protein, partial [Candidatus Binatia bacterium]